MYGRITFPKCGFFIGLMVWRTPDVKTIGEHLGRMAPLSLSLVQDLQFPWKCTCKRGYDLVFIIKTSNFNSLCSFFVPGSSLMMALL